MKKIILFMVMVLILGGCAKKLPPQVGEGRAFSKQPYVVQGNIRYSILDYRIETKRLPLGSKKTYAIIKIKAENMGSAKENLTAEDFKYRAEGKTFPLQKVVPENFIKKSLQPKTNLESNLFFNISNFPKGSTELLIKKGKIIIE